MKTFLLRYPFKGDWWGFDLKAESLEDAEARLEALRFAKVDGELKLRVRVPLIGWWDRIRRSL